MSFTPKKIAIVGAGLTGLLTAKSLQSQGHKVILFEKARGRGGRLSTKRTDFGNFDIGAQYFTAESSGFKTLVQEWLQADVVEQWIFTPHKASNEGVLPSPDNRVRFVAKPMMNSLSHYLAQGLNIQFQTRLKQFDCTDNGWILEFENGEKHEGFDHLILTSPAEQSKELLKNSFHETLNDEFIETAKALNDHTHLPCWAVGLKTKGLIPSEVQGIFGDDTVSWVSRLTSRPGREQAETNEAINDWMVHFNPKWSEANPKETDKDLSKIALNWLNQKLSSNLELTENIQHFWLYANINPEVSYDGILSAMDNQLIVGGAWCFGGKIEGAYLAATSIVESLKD